MTTYLFKQWLAFFYKSIPRRVFKENWHLLIMDGHGFHVTIWTLEQITKVRLDMVTLHAHISHALSHWMSFASNHSRHLLEKWETLPWWKTTILNQTKLH
jgi:hypothetical protein